MQGVNPVLGVRLLRLPPPLRLLPLSQLNRTTVPRPVVLHRHCAPEWKVCGSPALSKSFGTIFSNSTCPHSISVSYLGNSLNTSAFFLIMEVNGDLCSVIFDIVCHAKSLQSCPTLFTPVDSSPPGSSVRGILQARIPEWVVMPSSRGSP